MGVVRPPAKLIQPAIGTGRGISGFPPRISPSFGHISSFQPENQPKTLHLGQTQAKNGLSSLKAGEGSVVTRDSREERATFRFKGGGPGTSVPFLGRGGGGGGG